MNRREFFKGITAITAFPVLHKIVPKDHGIPPITVKDPSECYKEQTVLWCQIDFSKREVEKNDHSWEAIESLVDAKLDNAKETIMELLRENLKING